MSASLAESGSTAPKYNIQNLLPAWKPGKSANPGGFRKNAVRGDLIYQRLAAMKTADLRDYEAQNAVEDGVKQCILRACDADDWQKAHAAIKELVDRLDGKATQRKEVEISVNIEEKREISIMSYTMLSFQRTFEEAVEELRTIYASDDFDERLNAHRAAIEAQQALLEPILEQVEAEMQGQKG